MKGQNKRDADISILSSKGFTQAEIAKKYNITRQRVQQIERRLGVVRNRIPKIYDIQCRECGVLFTASNLKREYCSRKCSALGRCVYKTADARRFQQERIREMRRVRASKYYHEVLKKKSNWREIVHDRNMRASRQR